MDSLLRIFPQKRRDFWKVTADKAQEVCEIRLRVDRPVIIETSRGDFFLDHSGIWREEPYGAYSVTETEIPDWMAADGVAQCFKTTILSSKVRQRKPDPDIYHLACRCIGTPEANCAYVGDNPVRDVEGTQAAGFGMMIRIDEPDTLNKEKATGKEFTPDHVITSLSELLDIFPERA